MKALHYTYDIWVFPCLAKVRAEFRVYFSTSPFLHYIFQLTCWFRTAQESLQVFLFHPNYPKNLDYKFSTPGLSMLIMILRNPLSYQFGIFCVPPCICIPSNIAANQQSSLQRVLQSIWKQHWDEEDGEWFGSCIISNFFYLYLLIELIKQLIVCISTWFLFLQVLSIVCIKVRHYSRW